MQDPEKFLKDEGAATESLQRGQAPVLDSSMRAQVNFEIYFFERVREEALPRGSEPVLREGDRSDHVRALPSHDGPPKTTYGNRLYYFASDSTRTVFLADPVTHKDAGPAPDSVPSTHAREQPVRSLDDVHEPAVPLRRWTR